ncbi:MAG: phenylalanine--tRNA ligase subunit beta [bacterium]
MRIPCGWIREFVKIDVTPEELCQCLTMLGFGDAGVVPGEWDVLDSFVVGRASEVKPHPTDSHLKLVRVNVGYADLVSVCGAPNVEEGRLYAVALPGARLGTGRVVDTAEVGGVLSRCVLCSGKEAWLDESKDELLEVEDDNAPGLALVEALGLTDSVIEVEVTPNRSDWLGLVGIARELAAVFGKELLLPEPSVEGNRPIPGETVRIEVEDHEGCPRYGALLCDHVIVRGSPARTRARLRLAGVRPINNIVDATNLVLYETGHPLHAFDLDKIADHTIVVRRARDGEKIVGIDGNQYDLIASDLVIADARRPVAIAGVMGGKDSEVGPSTRRILIEGAYFDHRSVWRTSKRLGLSTEASYRFERGVDIGAVLWVLARTGSMIQADVKCMVPVGMIDVYPNPPRPRRLLVSPKRINRLLGTSIPEQEICDYLERLGFLVSPGKDLEVVIPTRRGDVDCEADIAEDVARLYGYDRIGERTALASQTYAKLPEGARRTREIKHIMKGMGLREIVTESMIGRQDLEALSLGSYPVVEILNPLGVRTSCLRPSLLPGVVKVLLDNEFNGRESVAVFELGKAYRRDGDGYAEPYKLAIGLSGARQERSWHTRAEDFDVFDLKGLVENLGDLVDVRMEFREGGGQGLHPGRRMEVFAVRGAEEIAVGALGEILPSVCEALGSKRRLCAAEIDFSVLQELSPKDTRYKEIPRFPAVKRDLAVVVPEAVRERDVRQAIVTEAGALVESVGVFDLYRGSQIPEGTKSLAYAIVFRSESGTLKEEDIDEIQRKIEARLVEGLGAKIRDK